MSPIASKRSFSEPGAVGSVDLRSLWLAIVKRRQVIVFSLLSTLVPTVVYILFSEPTYRASAVIQLDPASANVLPYKDIADPLGGVPHYELYIKTQDEILRGAVVRERAVGHIKEKFQLSGYPRLDEELSEGPSIERVPGSLMLRVSFVSSNPMLAAAVPNAWAEEFIALQQEKRKDIHESATSFLKEQLQKLERNVRDAEARLLEYSRQNAALDLHNGEVNVVRQRYDYLSQELARAEKDRMAAEAESAELPKLTSQQLPAYMKNPLITSLETEKYKIEHELSGLLSKFGENWPAVKQKRSELELVHVQLRSAHEAVLAEALRDAQMQQSASRTEEQLLRRAVSEQQVLVNRLNQASVDYQTLTRDVETSEEIYNGLLQRLKEATVGAGMDLGNVHISSLATPPEEPYRPRKALSVFLALTLGLTFGFGLSVILESMKNTIEDPWEVEGLGIPLLGWLPAVEKVSDCGEVKLLPKAEDGSAPALALPTLAKLNGSRVKRVRQTDNLATECIRTLCSSIVLSQAGEPPCLITVSSAVPGEGKTTTAAAVGAALAEMDFRTLIVDADFRRPALAKRMGVDAKEGLSTFLAGGSLNIRETKIANLFILPAGPNPPNPMALLSSARACMMWKKLREDFRFVVIDSPPVLSVADTSVLGTVSDGIILVVNAGTTPTDVIRRAVHRLEQSGASIFGAAVNRVNLNRPQYSSYRRYYYTDSHQV